MRQFINFAFYANWGVCPPFEGLDRNKNLKFSIIFYVLPAYKISLQSDNFYFLSPPLKGGHSPWGLWIKINSVLCFGEKNYIRID